jgi:DNA invertase Pin-like site-specific DNA recombinase
MKRKELYNVAIYLRLSRDDEDMDGGKVESNSISSQRDLIRTYIRKQPDMEIFDIYVDDGWSGANFDRPAFKRMMEDIEAGAVDCVIVKDLSRFGRDYIEAGRLIQKTFPAFSVRFIAINDNFDSLTADFNETSLVVPVKNFVNDSYCRDISNKVRSQQKVRREKGEYIGPLPIYGYQKDPDDHNHLVVDDYAASNVRKIFAWKLDGYSNQAIATKLEKMGVLSPLEYKRVRGYKCSTNFVKKVRAEWSPVAVKRILQNEMYIGTMVQGRYEKVNYKVKKVVEKPEAEWVKVENTHEAIIDKEDFAIVQRLLQYDFKHIRGEEKGHMFTGLLFCGDCKEPLVRRVNHNKNGDKVLFICSTSNRGKGCFRHSIEENELKNIVLSALKQQLALYLDKTKVLASLENMEVHFDEVMSFDKELKELRKEQDKYSMLRSGLYEDLKQGIITADDFQNFKEIYDERYVKIQEAIEQQEQTIKDLFKAGVCAGAKLERMKSALTITELNRDVLVTFVRRILLYDDKRIYVELNCKDMLSKLVMLEEYMDAVTEKQGKEAL